MSWKQSFYLIVAFFVALILMYQFAEMLHAQEHPICQHSDSDSDGDGYGWENDKTCVVRDDKQTPPNETSCQIFANDILRRRQEGAADYIEMLNLIYDHAKLPDVCGTQ